MVKDKLKKLIKNIRLSWYGSVMAVLFIASLSVVLQGRLWGKEVSQLFSKTSTSNVSMVNPTTPNLEQAGFSSSKLLEIEPGIWDIINADGIKTGTVISSTYFSGNIQGYGGPIPLLLFLTPDQLIQKVVLLNNHESPEFMADVVNSPVLTSWQNKPIHEALNSKVDALSGATISSMAVINSIKLSFSAMNDSGENLNLKSTRWVKVISAFIVLILTLILVFSKSYKSGYRKIILALNVVVLGFWCGNFITINYLTTCMANGVSLKSNPIQGLLLLVVLMGGLSGKKNIYCNWICPFGAAQELAGHLGNEKWRLSAKTIKMLGHLKEGIFITLMILVWLNVFTSVFNYEPFSAFQFMRSNIVAIVMACIFIALSIFIKKPWCRFVCPTGHLLNLIHK